MATKMAYDEHSLAKAPRYQTGVRGSLLDAFPSMTRRHSQGLTQELCEVLLGFLIRTKPGEEPLSKGTRKVSQPDVSQGL